MRHDITIANHVIGEGNRCFLIAEIAQAHDGSLGFAHSYIDLAHQSGADAVKFQVHIADAESTLDEQFRVASLMSTKLDLTIGNEWSFLTNNGLASRRMQIAWACVFCLGFFA